MDLTTFVFSLSVEDITIFVVTHVQISDTPHSSSSCQILWHIWRFSWWITLSVNLSQEISLHFHLFMDLTCFSWVQMRFCTIPKRFRLSVSALNTRFPALALLSSPFWTFIHPWIHRPYNWYKAQGQQILLQKQRKKKIHSGQVDITEIFRKISIRDISST